MTDNFDLEAQALIPGGRARATTPVSVRVDNEQIEHLKMLARYVAYHRDEEMSYVDLIREALEMSFPVPLDSYDAAKQKLMALSKAKLTERERQGLVQSYAMSLKLGESISPEDFMRSYIEQDGLPAVNLGDFVVEFSNHKTLSCCGHIMQAGSVNVHGDIFTEADLSRPVRLGNGMGPAYQMWIGVPVYPNINSLDDITKAIGVVTDVYWDKRCAAVSVRFDLHLEAFPEIRVAIENKIIRRVSYAVTVGNSVCSVCGNISEKDAPACEHVKQSKGPNKTTETNYGVKPMYLYLSS